MPWPQLSDFTVYIWTCTGPEKVSTTRGARLDLTAGLYHVPRGTAWSNNRTAPNGSLEQILYSQASNSLKNINYILLALHCAKSVGAAGATGAMVHWCNQCI